MRRKSGARSNARRSAFTLIELLVVVAIIALLVSILLPSLSKAREQAKAAVCASRMRSFGQASALYESQFKSFVPCDPFGLMPTAPPGSTVPARSGGEWTQRVDPAHGWLAFFGMDITPDIRRMAPMFDDWEQFPYGFRLQSTSNPEDLWEGFFCPSQNRRNTMTLESPELDPFHDHEGYPTIYKYASGYMVNRILRSATRTGLGDGTRWPAKPSDAFEAAYGPQDNIFGWCVVYLDAGSGTDIYHLQATGSDELVAAAETMYMGDSLDYHLSESQGSIPYESFDWRAGVDLSAGQWEFPYGEPLGGPPDSTSDPAHVVLSGRHFGKSNVLYADSHVSRDNQVTRDRRGDLVIAATFADHVETDDLGSQFHLMPCWRKYK